MTGDFIILSTADWFTRYWTNKQHTALTLAARGYRVLYVETPGIRRPRLGNRRDVGRLWRRLVSGLRQLAFGPRQVRDNVWVLSPLALPLKQDLPAVKWLNEGFLKFSLRRFVKGRRFEGAQVWSYHPFMLDALASMKLGTLSYHCVDDLAAVPGVDAAVFREAEDRMLRHAEVVFATAPALEERCRAINHNVHLVSNVVDPAHFGTALDAGREPADLAPISRPRLGFHGMLSEFKIDIELLAAVAEARPGWQIVLVGDVRDGTSGTAFDALRGRPNVHFLGGRDYRDLPPYLRGFDVGLLPSRINAYTSAMYPMKYFEYLAAGVPVAATALPALDASGGAVAMGETPEAFVAAVETQLRRGRLSRSEAIAAVGDHTWDARLTRMLESIAGVRR
jgi:glycosyltransferase involved in cell wall biosynthesis